MAAKKKFTNLPANINQMNEDSNPLGFISKLISNSEKALEKALLEKEKTQENVQSSSRSRRQILEHAFNSAVKKGRHRTRFERKNIY
jgi:hypothetical protein